MKNFKKVKYDVVKAVKSAFKIDLVGLVHVRRKGRNVWVITQANDTTNNLYVYECTPEGRVSLLGYYEAVWDGTLWPVAYDPVSGCYKL